MQIARDHKCEHPEQPAETVPDSHVISYEARKPLTKGRARKTAKPLLYTRLPQCETGPHYSSSSRSALARKIHSFNPREELLKLSPFARPPSPRLKSRPLPFWVFL